MSQDYESTVGLPLFASLALLFSVVWALLVWGGRLCDSTRRQPSTTASAGANLVRSRWPLWLLIVTMVFLAANQLLVRGVAAGRWDVDGQFYPYYVLVADHARAARLAQWDPWSNGGLPVLGDPQVGVFSPVKVALGLITGGTSTGFRIYWLLLWWLGGFGVFMLGRHLKAPPWGACAVALGFLFCGVYTGNAEHTSWITAFSFLPVAIWRLDVALSTGSFQPAAEAGAIWGLSALAGYPGVIILTGCFAALWTLGRWLTGRRESDVVSARTGELSPGFAFASVMLVLLVGVLVLSPTYLAFFVEGAGSNPRVDALTREIALSNSLEPGALATFATPYLTALKVVRQFMVPVAPPGELWPATDASMVNVYTGAIIPSLALLALLRRPRNGWNWWLAGLGVLSLACAMGETLPFRGWLYEVFYPTRFFRHSAIFRLYWVFAICVLALIGTRILAADLRRAASSARACFFVASIGVASAAVLAVSRFIDPAWSEGMPDGAVLLGRIHFGWIWTGVCVVAFLAWRLPRAARVWRVPVLLVGLAAGDALVTSVLSIPTVLRIGEAAERWDSLDARHRATLDLGSTGLLRKSSSCEPDLLSVRCRSNDQLITKVPVFNSYATEKNAFHLAMTRHPVLKDMATGTERIWFAREVARVAPTEDWFAAFRGRAEMLGAPPLVIHSSGALLRLTRENPSHDPDAHEVTSIARLPAAERIHADVVRYLPEELVLEVHTATDGWLLVTDRWARGWRAEVNGRRTPLYGGNFIFRAIRVSAGPNRVRFTYVPVVFPWFVAVSWGTMAVVAVGAVRARARRASTML